MRIILVLLGIYHAANGIVMFVAPEFWYAAVPGADGGPLNAHFIRDIGLAFLAAGTALLMTARLGVNAALLIPASVFLGGHALLHLGEMALHGTTASAAVLDVALVVIPSLLPLYALWHATRRAAGARA